MFGTSARRVVSNLVTQQQRSIISLSTLKPKAGSKHVNKRLGRGRSSGKGKTSGRGQKGYYARSGASGLIWYEGGQSQLWRRTPKFGFKNVNRKPLYPLNIGRLVQAISEGRVDPTKTITMGDLYKGGVIGKVDHGVKLLASNAEQALRVPVPLDIEVTHASRRARDFVRQQGGDVKFKWYSKLGLKNLLFPGYSGPHVQLKDSVPPPRLQLRYEHQFCGKDDLLKLEQLRKARIQRKIKKRL